MLFSNNLITILLIIPVLGSLLLVLIPKNKTLVIKIIGLSVSSFSFIISLFLWVWFDKSLGYFQFVTKIGWLPFLNINFTLGVDGISLFLILLTTLLTLLCLLISWNSIAFNVKEYVLSFLIMEFFLIGVFCVLDLLLFYILFESVLIPMFFIIGIWGSRERKIRASFFFFLYTLLGSVLMLLGIFYIFYQVGTTDYEILLTYILTDKEQKLLWLAFFSSFASANSDLR